MTAGDDRRGAADAAGVSGGNSLDQLEAQLEEAERIFQKDHLRGAAAALDAVFDDLLARGIRHRGPVLALRAGLQDLADGAPPEWLKVGKGRGRVRLGREERLAGKGSSHDGVANSAWDASRRCNEESCRNTGVKQERR